MSPDLIAHSTGSGATGGPRAGKSEQSLEPGGRMSPHLRLRSLLGPAILIPALLGAWAGPRAAAEPPPPAPTGPVVGSGVAAAERTAIAWYGTWKGARAEAERSGRPILLLSAAPQCHGISGVW
jgi:hypothetical protein